MYNISLLPNQLAINSVASLSDDFHEANLDFKCLLSKLKLTIVESGFLSKQDNEKWFSLKGIDYLYNPKLFVHAPLNCICVFLSELFKLHENEYIYKKVPLIVIKSALKRLVVFKVDK
jgi:hypothetical protein